MGGQFDDLQASLADRYILERELGTGGMATVYLARDARHNRKVAIKVLRAEVSRLVGADRFLADRFLKEIETTANLQHPNILPLFDSGHVDGTVFYDIASALDYARDAASVSEAGSLNATGLPFVSHTQPPGGSVFRPLTPLLLLLALVSSVAAAQETAAAGDEASAEARRVEHSRQFAIGMSAWPTEWYCSGPMSAAMQQVPPKEVLRRIQLASRCGLRLFLVPPRRMLTADGLPDGRFSVDAARQTMDRYARELPPDTLAKYRSTILGFNLGDDYGCEHCWGGEPITQSEVAEWAVYAREKLPGVALGVRVVPEWVARDPQLASLIDYAWAQYHTRKGDAKSYYDKAASAAEKLGLKVVMGVNVKDCYGVGTDPCTPDDLVRYGRMALSHPASCAFLNWRYDENTWKRADIRQVWQGLIELAKKRGPRECRRTAAG